MVPFDFDQTNGNVHGLRGDDGGAIAPPERDRTVLGFVQKLMGAGPVPKGTAPVDHDPSITAYSEEGLR